MGSLRSFVTLHMEKYGWIARIAVISFFGVGGALASQDPEVVPRRMVIIGTTFFFLASLLNGWWILRLGRASDTRDWSRPRWTGSPFRSPPQFFHMAAWSFVSFGIANLLPIALRGGSPMFGALALAAGSGLLIGMRLFYLQSDKGGRAA